MFFSNDMGRFSLTNLKTDKIRTYMADDVQQEIVRMRFELDLGIFHDTELQKEYNETGLEVYRFDEIEE